MRVVLLLEVGRACLRRLLDGDLGLSGVKVVDKVGMRSLFVGQVGVLLLLRDVGLRDGGGEVEYVLLLLLRRQVLLMGICP